jgi:hypothetical protein
MPAGGFSVSAPSGVEFEAKITPIVIISCIMAATGGLMFGYDVGISGNAAGELLISSDLLMFSIPYAWVYSLLPLSTLVCSGSTIIMRNSSFMERHSIE